MTESKHDTSRSARTFAKSVESGTPGVGEQRRLPRLVLDAPARLRLHEGEERMVFPVTVRDLSSSGCCILAPEENLGGYWTPKIGALVTLEMPLPDVEVSLTQAGCIVWCQRSKQGDYTLGMCFDQVSPDQQEVLRAIFSRKLRDQFQVPVLDEIDADDPLLPLEIPLHVDARCSRWKGLTPGRLELLSLNTQRMILRHAPREGGPKRIPLPGTVMDLSIFPPVWSGGEQRTLWICAQVVKADLESVELVYEAGENHLDKMIRALIPEKINRPAPPKEFPIAYILLALAALFAFLFVSSR